ncbi:MAG TPA: lysylphosphatidylglycerol synthase transmembrane domain-containing protein [Terrimicrobiaceae bacterium]
MKRLLLTLLQLGVTVFLLWWIFRDPIKRTQMVEALLSADYLWLIPGLLSIGCAFLLQTERWRRLLEVQGIHLGWWRTFRVYLIGAFFNLFLLGATGGDIVKIYYAMRETSSKKAAAFLSVLVDRMVGMLGLVAISTLLCSLRLGFLLADPLTRALVTVLAFILGGSLAVIIFAFCVDRFQLVHKLPPWLPMHGTIVELATAFSTYTRDPRVLAWTFGLSIPAHLCIFLSFYFAARAFGLFAGIGGMMEVLAVLPVILTIASLPISLSGVGVREGLFQNVLAALYGTPESVAVMISITGFLMVVFWGLIGGCVYLVHRPVGGVHLEEVEEEVHAIEESIEDKA